MSGPPRARRPKQIVAPELGENQRSAHDGTGGGGEPVAQLREVGVRGDDALNAEGVACVLRVRVRLGGVADVDARVLQSLPRVDPRLPGVHQPGAHIHGGGNEEITFEPPPPEAWSGLALVLAKQQKFAEAEKTLVHLEEHGPLRPLEALHRAVFHEAKGERERALEMLDFALRERHALTDADHRQIRIVVAEETALEDLRTAGAFAALMTQFYGRTAFPAAPPKMQGAQ